MVFQQIKTTANPGFTAFADFAIAADLFLGSTPGLCNVPERSIDGNPIGLRVEGQLTALAQVPEPSSMLLFLSAAWLCWPTERGVAEIDYVEFATSNTWQSV